jgi:glycine cleavage system H protein
MNAEVRFPDHHSSIINQTLIRRCAVKPEELLFAKTHEWISLAEENGQKVATMGLSAFAVDALTDLVFIELPKVGRQVTAGESFCEVESVKAVSDIYAPLAGEVVAVNTGLPDNLDTLSNDPFEGGWIAKLKVTDDANLKNLLDYAAYQKQCAEEAH